MSATRDKSHRPIFVFTPVVTPETQALNPVDAAGPIAISKKGIVSGRVIKAASPEAARAVPLAQALPAQPEVKEFRPAELMGKRLEEKSLFVQKPEVLLKSQNSALESLKQNLHTLNELHSRLKFMLKEIEDLVKE